MGTERHPAATYMPRWFHSLSASHHAYRKSYSFGFTQILAMFRLYDEEHFKAMNYFSKKNKTHTPEYTDR